MTTTTEAQHATLAKVAAGRAQTLREQAAALSSEAVGPLRAALLIRAGELDLAAAALGDQPTTQPTRHLAIA